MLIVLRKQAFLQTREQRMEQESQDNWVHIDGRRKNKVQSYKPLQKIITKLVAVFCLLFFVRGCGQYSLSLSNHLILKSRKVFSLLSSSLPQQRVGSHINHGAAVTQDSSSRCPGCGHWDHPARAENNPTTRNNTTAEYVRQCPPVCPQCPLSTCQWERRLSAKIF